MSTEKAEFKSSNGINWKAPKHLVSTLESSDSVAKSQRKTKRRKKK